MADPRQPSWGEVFDTILTARLRSVHTAMVGEIRSYSEADQTAEVTAAFQLEADSGEFVELPPLADVPVLWPGAWAAGDTCLLVFSEESFSKWWDTGSVEQPEVLRRHGLHAVCIPVVARAGQAVQFVALANLVTAALDALRSAISSAALTESGAGGLGGMTALDSFLDAQLPPWPPGVAAEKVKAR
jgi:hypothetical protein